MSNPNPDSSSQPSIQPTGPSPTDQNQKLDQVKAIPSKNVFKSNLLASFRRIKDQMKKEFKLLKTDKINAFIALGLPPLTIILFALMLSTSLPKGAVRVSIVSYDANCYFAKNNENTSQFCNDNYTMPLVQAFNATQSNMTVHTFYNGSQDYYAMEKARAQMTNKEIDVIIIIPADFTELLQNGAPGIIDAIPDTSNVQEVQRYINQIQAGVDRFSKMQNMTPQFEIRAEFHNELPADRSITYNYMITLVLGFIIFAVSCVLTILVVVQEQPIPRLLLTPARRTEILAAKFLAYVLILLIQIMLIYIAVIFNGGGLYIRGNLFDLFISLFLMGYVGISLGMLISTSSKTKMEANQLFFASFIVILLFSGIFIPISSMPPYLQVIANLLPLSHGAPMISRIVAKGKPAWGPDFIYLLVQAILFTAVAFFIIRRKNYEV